VHLRSGQLKARRSEYGTGAQQYTMGLALQKAGLTRARKSKGRRHSPPDLVKAFGQGQVDAVNLAAVLQAAEQQASVRCRSRLRGRALAMINSW